MIPKILAETNQNLTKAKPTAQIPVEQTLITLEPAQSSPIKIKQIISKSVEINKKPVESPKKRAEKILEPAQFSPKKTKQSKSVEINKKPVESPKKKAGKTLKEFKIKPARSEQGILPKVATVKKLKKIRP